MRLLSAILFALTALSAHAQTNYSPMPWGLNKGVTPYQFGANINGTWSNLGTVSSAGVWQIPTSSLYYYRIGTTYDNLGNPYLGGVIALGANNFNINSPAANSQNVGYGIGALTALTTGYQNIALGQHVLPALTSGYGNVAVGKEVLDRLTIGVFNTGVGTDVLRYLDDSLGLVSANVGLGHGAMAGDDFGYYPLTGSGNTALGNWTMQELTAGQRNIAVGMNAGMNLQSGNDNAILGFAAQVCSFDSVNTRVPGGCSASANVAIGSNALQTNKASSLVAVGYYALNKNTTGTYNVAIGANTLQNATTAIGNLGVGPSAIDQLVTGDYNTGLGGFTLHGVGAKSYNTAVGWGAGSAVTTGNGNVLVGWNSGAALTNEGTNTFIGTQAGSAATGLNNVTAIGYNATPTASNQVILGDANVTEVKTSAGLTVGRGSTFSSVIIFAGTKPTATGAGGTCAAGTVTGGAVAGTVALTAACASTNTLALTGMPTVTNGYVCDAADRTSGVLNLVQTATTTTSATFTFNATTGATDVIQFKCMGY